MKQYYLSLLCWALLFADFGFSQDRAHNDLRAQIETMKITYAGSGSILVLDDKTLLIEPNMPGPVCSLPKNENGKTSWSRFAFPLASITVPLATVDESLISEDIVFTNPDAAKDYKPGDVGDSTMVVVVGVEGRHFHTLMYDREKLVELGPGIHDSKTYGQAPDDVEAFGLTFADHEAARAFVAALRNAVAIAKAQTVAKAESR
jgi:hypothetical protein